MQYELFCDADFLQEQPLAGRSICLLGTFRQTSKALRQRLKDQGADVKQGLSRGLHYVVLGENVPADTEDRLSQFAFHGYQLKVLNEQGLEDLLNAQDASAVVPEQIGKDLHLTYGHYLSLRLNYEERENPLYTKELYLPQDVQPALYQMLGNHGVYANAYIDDTTDVIVLSDASLLRLQEGQTDETLRYIERQYNQSRAQTFRFSLTSERELVEWLRR